MENVGIPDFIDVVYAYSINSSEHRPQFRSGMMSYFFDYKQDEVQGAEDMSFEGFQKSSLSMIDELDAFQLG